MLRLLIHLAALPFCLAGLSKTAVHQSPSAVITDPVEELVINCNHSNSDFTMIQWYRQTVGQTDMVLVGYARYSSSTVEKGFETSHKVSGSGASRSSLHVLKPSGASDNAVYFCAASRGDRNNEAYFGGGTKLTVLETGRKATAPTVKLLKPSPNECRHNNKTLVCLATNFYPDHVTVIWKVNGEDTTDGVATDSAAKREDYFYSITSRLRINAKTWHNPGNNFTCIVRFFNGTESPDYTAEIQGIKDSTEGESAEGGLSKEDYVKVTQNAKLSFTVLIFKGLVYGVFVAFLICKLQGSSGKQSS